MADTLGKRGQKKKARTVRHTRALQRDRRKRPPVTPPVGEIEARLTAVIHPATYAQVAASQADGRLTRILTLPVMVALVRRILGRPIGAVSEAVRVLRAEGLLGRAPRRLAAGRLATAAPPSAYARRTGAAGGRAAAGALRGPRAPPTARGGAGAPPLHRPPRARRLDAGDGAAPGGAPAGARRRAAGCARAVATRLPQQLWDEEEGRAADQRFWAPALAPLTADTLLFFDRGFLD